MSQPRPPPPPPPSGPGGSSKMARATPPPPPNPPNHRHYHGNRPPPPKGPPSAPASHRPRPPPPQPPQQQQHFDESLLPSVRDGTLSPSEERDRRRRTCRFIEECGRILKLPRVAIATAMVFLHRFYAKHSFGEHDRFEVAVACLLLAAKTEESPKKLTSVVVQCHALKNRAMRKSSGAPGNEGGMSPGSNSPRNSSDAYLDTKSEEYNRLKERVLLLERVVLHTIGFELSIDHPYKFLVDQIKKMNQTRQIDFSSKSARSPPSTSPSQPPKTTNELVQFAMNFANDSMHTSLCLQFPPKIIGLACVYLSGQFCKVKPADGKSWIDVLGIDPDALASISVQIMELVADRKGLDHSLLSSIRADLDRMRDMTAPSGRKHPPPLPSSSSSSSSSGPRDVKKPRLS